jgi:uncharacterized protein
MLIDIERLPKEGLSLSKDFEFLNEDLVEESAVFLRPAHADLVVKRAGDEIQIKGRLTAMLSFVCSRCLSPYQFPVDSAFDLVFLPEELEDAKDELEDDDIDRAFYYGGSIDIAEVVLEQLNLTFPVKPLCSPACEGLCAVCGQIRHSGQCGCQVKEPEARTERIKSLNKR